MSGGITIAVPAKYFLYWSGGVDFLRNCANALLLKGDAVRLHLLFPRRTAKGTLIDFLLPYKRRVDETILSRKPLDCRGKPASKNALMDSLSPKGGNLFSTMYREERNGLLSCLDAIRADVLLPVAESPGASYPCPWLGYIPDLQHKNLPHFFSKEECAARDLVFAGLLRDARGVIVNSRAARTDIEKFYPEFRNRLFAMPFSPVPRPGWFDGDPSACKRRYGLPNRYFLISNQFWVHKSHGTAFEALYRLRRNLPASDVHIVCTGETRDYRFPDYFGGLKTRIEEMGLSGSVHFLGHIPKNDQIQIMRGAVAVLQPTLCEGGPGGGAVYDAVATGTPVLASDIPVNREIEGDNVFFFRARSSDDMAGTMADLLKRSVRRPSTETLLERGARRADRLGNALLEAAAFGIASSRGTS
jgi:glycosyltransferase involved in cell wall biosynthesis